MPDREKVIKEFELFIKEFHPACTSEGVELDMLREILTLLKEQQKLIDDTPHWVFGDSNGHAWMKCSNCCVSQSGQTGCWSYCPNCGAKMEGQVEWDE